MSDTFGIITGTGEVVTPDKKKLIAYVFAGERAILEIVNSGLTMRASIHVTEKEAMDYALAIIGAVHQAQAARKEAAAVVPTP